MIGEYREILPGVYLRTITTDKFKTGCFSVSFMEKLSADTAAMNALLPKVLCRGSKNKPDMQSISKVSDNLYGMQIEPTARKFGDVQIFGIMCDCVDGRYTDAGDGLLEECIALAGEILLNPRVENQAFFEDYVAGEKENLKNEILSESNNKLSYAYRRAMACMYPDCGFGLSELGEIDKVEEIDASKLYKDYLRVINNAEVEIFYCGSASFVQVEKAVKVQFAALSDRDVSAVKVSAAKAPMACTETVEQMDMSQAVLLLGTSPEVTFADEDLPAMRVLSSVLGGGTASKLFVNVREKKSLCYYTGTRYDRFNGSMFMYCGVEPEMVDKARAELIRQLDECINGNIADDELMNAKRQLINQYKTINDSAYSLENYWLAEAVSGMNMSLEQIMKDISRVTAEQVSQVAEKCELKLTYLLTGKGENVHERKYIPGN